MKYSRNLCVFPNNANAGDEKYAFNISGEMMPETSGISIVIPNYNGEQLLEQNLPSIIAALTHWGGQSELIVVDDCSADSSCQLIAERFPQVRLLVNSSNLGFSKSCNIGFNKANYPVGICINNDVNVEVDFIAPLLKSFQDKNV